MLRHLFGLETYGLVQLVALLLFGALAVALCRRAGLRLRHAVALTLLYLLCNFLVAKVLFDYVKAGGRHTLWQHPALGHFLEGGYWGWPLAFLPCALLYPFALRLQPVPFYRVVAFLLPPVLAVQKVGCFAAGCCFGCETALPWAVVFPDDSLCETPGVPVHPLQLYDAVLPLGILGVLVVVDRRGGEPARPFLLPGMVGLYALAPVRDGVPPAPGAGAGTPPQSVAGAGRHAGRDAGVDGGAGRLVPPRPRPREASGGRPVAREAGLPHCSRPILFQARSSGGRWVLGPGPQSANRTGGAGRRGRGAARPLSTLAGRGRGRTDRATRGRALSLYSLADCRSGRRALRPCWRP
jgi:phosphatidylglycerol:prolipoprotein diacylglycerol transferase